MMRQCTLCQSAEHDRRTCTGTLTPRDCAECGDRLQTGTPRHLCGKCTPDHRPRSVHGYHTPKSCGHCGDRGHNIRTCDEARR